MDNINNTEKEKSDKSTDGKPKTLAELEKITRESSLKSLDEYFGFIEGINQRRLVFDIHQLHYGSIRPTHQLFSTRGERTF